MKREKAIKKVDIFFSGKREAIEIFDDFESRICKNCEYFNKDSEVCVNDESPLCADFVNKEYGCNVFKRIGII